MKRVGFIGLGMMGYPMAHLLHQAGYPLTVLDTAAAQVARFLTEHPGVVAADRLAAFGDVEAVITMLPNSDIVDAVVLGQADQPGLIDILPSGATVIDMSSSQPLRSQALAQALNERGLHFLDAPVSGGVRRAVGGSLAIMVGGGAAQFHQHHDLFERMGKTITHVGGPGAGHALKALNNYVSAAGLVATAEALLVGQAFGLDPAIMTDVINSSPGKNNTTEQKVKQFMLSGTFNSGFAMQLMAKDLGMAMSLGEQLGWDMQLGKQVLRLWSEAASELERSADHTEMYRFLQAVEQPDDAHDRARPSSAGRPE
jgi:3-hydroxyisobutyrate dehydrogenase